MQDLMISLGAIGMVTLLATMSPGPNMVAVISASVGNGQKAGLLTGAGIVVAAMIWAIAALLGLATLFELFPLVALSLRAVGALYLIWLGIKSILSMQGKSGFSVPETKVRSTHFRAFKIGFTICITNPKALLFFGSVLTALVPARAPVWWSFSALLLMAGISMTMHTITATLFSRPAVMARYLKAKRVISGVFGVLFIGFGGKIALDTLRQLRS